MRLDGRWLPARASAAHAPAGSWPATPPRRPAAGRRRRQSASAARSPTCSPSQPPIKAPGPAGSRISQRIVLVMRPSSGSGVTAWRMARKLMKISTAPTPNVNSMNAKAATPQRSAGATASSSQPAPQIAMRERQARPRADAAAQARGRTRWPARCPRRARRSSRRSAARSSPAAGWRTGSCTTMAAWWHSLPAADHRRQRDQQTRARDEAQARQQVAPEVRVGCEAGAARPRARRAGSSADQQQHRRVHQQRHRRAEQRISSPARPGPTTSAPEPASAFLACASTRRSRATTWVSTICAALPAVVNTVPSAKPPGTARASSASPATRPAECWPR